MNKKSTLNVIRSVTSTLLILMITLALTSTLATFSAYAQGTVSVDPPKIVYDVSNGTIGTLFNISIWEQGVTDMKTWQLKMGFNDSIINVTRWYEPTWDPTYVFYGKTTLPVPAPPKVRYEAGWLGVGSALFPAPSVGGGFTGDGLLCIITFNITAVPVEQNYTSTFDLVYPTDTFWIKTGEAVKRSFETYNNGEYWIIPELAPVIMLITLMAATIIIVARARKHIRKI